MRLNSLLFEQPGITIFGFKIYAYAIIIVCGMALAFFVISLLFRRRNMSTELFLTFFVICLPIAILTTRLFYCITDGLPISDWFSPKSLREGGLSIIGGIIGGALSILVVCLVKKINFFRVTDCVVIGVLLAQSIGRWGNFANQEVYGAQVLNEALQFFPISVYIESTGQWHYAFFFYESMVTLTAAILLFIFAWKNGKKPNGVISACYLIVYGLVRSIMEPLRDKQYILGDGVQWSLVMSIGMLVIGIGILVYVLLDNKKKEGSLFGSVHGDPYGISDYIADNKEDKPHFDKLNMMCALYPERYEKKAEESTDIQQNNSAESAAENVIKEDKNSTAEDEK